MMLPVGQSTWDDQWYDAANNLNPAEYWPLVKGLSLSSVVPSVAIVGHNGPEQIAISAFGIGPQKNKLLPSSLSVAAARYQRYSGPIIAGLSTAQDFAHAGRDASLYTADIRYTVPHIVTRAEYSWSTRTADRSKGGFLSLTYRPQHWSDGSLFYRYQVFKGTFGFQDHRQILGVKVRAPLDFTVNLNYAIAPHQGAKAGTGWSAQLYRVYRF
jgi:hypothetical protein